MESLATEGGSGNYLPRRIATNAESLSIPTTVAPQKRGKRGKVQAIAGLASNDESSLYDRVLQYIFFAGKMSPRSKIVERQLAEHLGVSRIPIRETLGKISGQGLLVGEEIGQGLRLRQYTPEEIRQLYEVRELLEGGAASAAAQSATDLDITRLQFICDRSDSLLPNRHGLDKWHELDSTFHIALAEASHNERIVRLLKPLLTECQYVSKCLALANCTDLSPEDLASFLQDGREEHRHLLGLVRLGKAEEAGQKARADLRRIAKRLTETLLASDLQN